MTNRELLPTYYRFCTESTWGGCASVTNRELLPTYYRFCTEKTKGGGVSIYYRNWKKIKYDVYRKYAISYQCCAI